MASRIFIYGCASSQANRPLIIVAAAMILIAAICSFLLMVICYLCRRKMKARGENEVEEVAICDVIAHEEDLDLPLMSLADVVRAMHHFDDRPEAQNHVIIDLFSELDELSESNEHVSIS